MKAERAAIQTRMVMTVIQAMLSGARKKSLENGCKALVCNIPCPITSKANTARREGFANPYETLKELTRKNEKITKDSITDFISNLDVSGKVKKELLKITPFHYTGI